MKSFRTYQLAKQLVTEGRKLKLKARISSASVAVSGSGPRAAGLRAPFQAAELIRERRK